MDSRVEDGWIVGWRMDGWMDECVSPERKDCT